jgi:hypothetical protein
MCVLWWEQVGQHTHAGKVAWCACWQVQLCRCQFDSTWKLLVSRAPLIVRATRKTQPNLASVTALGMECPLLLLLQHRRVLTGWWVLCVHTSLKGGVSRMLAGGCCGCTLGAATCRPGAVCGVC